MKPQTANKLSDSQKEVIVNFVEYLIDALTLKRVLLIALLGALFISLYSLFEHRSQAVNYLLAAPVNAPANLTSWKLSDQSKQILMALPKSFPIKYVDVTEVDLKRNSRVVRFIDAPELSQSSNGFLTEVYKPRPVFDHDSKNTTQLVAVLANEFKCENFTDTIYFRMVPNEAAGITTICHIAIPPFVGQFVGYLTVGLERKMAKSEMDTLRLEMSRIAVEIYLHDVSMKTDEM